MIKEFLTGIKLFIFLTLLLGIIYPFLTLFIARFIIPAKAEGSIITKNNIIIGSSLIGQNFSDDKYFHPRPSAINYNPYPSGGSNLAQTSRQLKLLYDERKQNFANRNYIHLQSELPVEMFFASASGVDPHISPLSAFIQIERIVKSRQFSPVQKEKLITIIKGLIEKPQLGFLGNSVINVLLLNIELDKIR